MNRGTLVVHEGHPSGESNGFEGSNICEFRKTHSSMIQSHSSTILLAPISLSLLQSTSAAGELTPAPLATSRLIAPTPVDGGTQSSIECLHEYARRLGRLPELGLFTTDAEEIIGPSSPEPNPPSPCLPPVSTDVPLGFSTTDDSENELEDAEDNDEEYLPTRRTTRLRRPVSPARASISSVSTKLPAKTRPGKRVKSPDDDESAKRQKSDTGDPEATPHEIAIDPKTGTEFWVIRDKKGRFLHYQCPVHDYTASSKGDIGRHMQSLRHRQPSFFCVRKTCGKKFTRIDALKRHVRNVHSTAGLVVVEHKTGAETYLGRRGEKRT